MTMEPEFVAFMEEQRLKAIAEHLEEMADHDLTK